MTWNRTAVTGALLAAMAAPLVLLPGHAQADLASAVNSGSYGPVVTIVTPQYADVVKGNSVSIAVAVEARSNPVKAVQMYVDDHIATPGWVPLKSLQSSKFNWNTTLFKNGPHKLTVRVVDSAGLIGQAEITVYVNNSSQQQQQEPTAPYLKWLGVQDGQVLNGMVNLELQASGSFGVKYIFVMINSVDDPDRKPALRSWMINQPPYIIPFDTTKVNDGLYVLDALAYDALSNQGEAPRLHVGIANNSINPTWYNELTPYQTNSKTPAASAPDNGNKPTTEVKSAPTKPATPPASKTTDTSNTAGNSGDAQSTNRIAQLQLPAMPQQQTPSTLSSGNNDNSASQNTTANENSLTVTVASSAEIRSSSEKAAPRISALPTDIAATESESAPAKSADATSQQPSTTIAQSKFAPEHGSKEESSPAAATLSLREAALPAQHEPQKDGMQQTSPRSTLVSTQKLDSARTSPAAKNSSLRLAKVDDALSLPQQSSAHSSVSQKSSKEVSNVQLPEFPSALLNKRSAAANVMPKSTFDSKPATGMTEANVSSRIAQTGGNGHHVARVLADAQLGQLPRLARATSIASPQVIAGRPLFTAPSTSLANSRIATADFSGDTWTYQHIIHSDAGQSTLPRLAFLPNFNNKKATPANSSHVAITISPASTMQVAEATHAWPAVYVTQANEPLAAVAKRYGLPVEVLATNNNLTKNAQLKAGQKVRMPRNLQLTYNGKPLNSDVNAMLVGTTSVAAFRFLFEQQGGHITWDAATQTVHAQNADTEVTVTIGSNQAVVNQKEVMMDLAAFLLSGRTMVPVRLFEQSMHAQVTWEPATGRMFMAMAGSDS